MKKRASEPYLIISSAHLGVSKDILSVLKQVTNYYKPKVIHLGPLIEPKTLKRYEKLNERIDKMSQKDLSESMEEVFHSLVDERDSIYETHRKTIKSLTDAFGSVKFVLNEDQMIPGSYGNGASFVFGGEELSKYLYLSPILPSAEASTNDPFSQKAMEYLRQFGQSCIVAHPVPSVKSMPRIGLNEAYNYWSVGSLRHQENPRNTKTQYLIAHLPAAILVLVDKENQEFHSRPLHFDYLERTRHSKKNPMILDDGLVFLENKTIQVGSADKANFVTDQHAKHWQPGVLACFRAANTLHQPETIIDGGDTADMGGSNRHAEGHPGEMLGEYIRNDLINLKYLLRAMNNEKCIKRKVMLDSNHHEWLSLRCAKDPALIGLLDWPTLAREMFSDWEVIIRKAGETDVFWFGDYMLRHGDKESGAASGSKLSALGKYMCGHWHSFRIFRRAIQLGCGCMLGPKYVGGKITSWQNMIATLTKYKEITGVSPKTILHDKNKKVSRFAYRGTIYEVIDYELKVNLNEPIYAK
jgi:hypothetical protein